MRAPRAGCPWVWLCIGGVMIPFLQEYLRIDTSHPTPDYRAVGKLFAARAQQDGLVFREIMLESGFPVYCITAYGSDTSLPALALNHHMDVVGVHAKEWQYPPFGGELVNDIIYGRGTQDCKSLGIIHYAALLHAREQKFKRTVHMLCVPHEEVGGFLGVGQLIKTEIFKNLNIGSVLDEGIPSGNPEQILVKVSERKPLQIKLIAHNQGGHAACIDAPNAIHDLLGAIALCNNLVAATNKSGFISSCTVTSLNAGSEHAHNVIPAYAQATLDIRVAAQTSQAELEKKIIENMRMHKTVMLVVCARVPDVPVNDYENSALYKQIQHDIRAEGMYAHPLHSEASSDLRWYHAAGIEGYGLTPFTCIPRLHSVDESVPVRDIVQGIHIFNRIVESLCR